MLDRYDCCMKYLDKYPETKIPIFMDLMKHSFKDLNNNIKNNINKKYGKWNDLINAEYAYTAWPDRLYIIYNKKIVFKSGIGPDGYLLDEMEESLKKYIPKSK